jgi:protocatechuate 3,4-dioxygenase beta subunit
MSKDIPITRRQTFAGLGAAGAGLIAARLAGIPDLGGAATTKAATCLLTPEQEEGPYYVDLNKVRTDITEGRPGVPLRLRIYVVDADTCKPIRRAAVDIWHCDALGVYSDESNQSTSGETWMRGVQLTDSSGLARFRTIYPGHYVGRTTHIHVKVHTGGKVVHTGQFFFTDRLSKEVYRLSPYKRDTQSYQARATDQVYSGQHGSSSVLKLKRRGSSLRRSGLTGAITLGVAT